MAASPASVPPPLLAAAIAWNPNLGAFHAAVGGSGQEAAPLAVAAGCPTRCVSVRPSPPRCRTLGARTPSSARAICPTPRAAAAGRPTAAAAAWRRAATDATDGRWLFLIAVGATEPPGHDRGGPPYAERPLRTGRHAVRPEHLPAVQPAEGDRPGATPIVEFGLPQLSGRTGSTSGGASRSAAPACWASRLRTQTPPEHWQPNRRHHSDRAAARMTGRSGFVKDIVHAPHLAVLSVLAHGRRPAAGDLETRPAA